MATYAGGELKNMQGYIPLRDECKLANDEDFRKTVLKSLWYAVMEEFDDERIRKPLEGIPSVYGPDGEDGNYRMDRQDKVISGPPRRYRYAIQINRNAPDPALKGVKRKTTSGSSLHHSQATVAQFEAEDPFEFTPDTSDLLREAFLQSIIPEDLRGDVRLHKVYITKEGQIWIKENALWKQKREDEEREIANRKPPQLSKGAKAKAKDAKKYAMQH